MKRQKRIYQKALFDFGELEIGYRVSFLNVKISLIKRIITKHYII